MLYALSLYGYLLFSFALGTFHDDPYHNYAERRVNNITNSTLIKLSITEPSTLTLYPLLLTDDLKYIKQTINQHNLHWFKQFATVTAVYILYLKDLSGSFIRRIRLLNKSAKCNKLTQKMRKLYIDIITYRKFTLHTLHNHNNKSLHVKKGTSRKQHILHMSHKRATLVWLL